ncbi:50S ribosomal protein L18 [Candidatus Gottesmanbacteria bacterium]|nr:50S ribosomal protein L18 [Candidatus Gottesmanbacteria bacterium]
MNTKRVLRTKRKLRIRAKISGTGERPRLSVYRSNNAIEVQAIDDTKQVTVAFAHVFTKNTAGARQAGADVAKKLIELGITRVIFDRGGYRYHGVIKALADAAREGGLKF